MVVEICQFCAILVVAELRVNFSVLGPLETSDIGYDKAVSIA
jgi:hypothetical protein